MSIPTWQELKLLLVGWLKDSGCTFYRGTGFSQDVLIHIVEYVWHVTLPPLHLHIQQ